MTASRDEAATELPFRPGRLPGHCFGDRAYRAPPRRLPRVPRRSTASARPTRRPAELRGVAARSERRMSQRYVRRRGAPDPPYRSADPTGLRRDVAPRDERIPTVARRPPTVAEP